MRCANSSTSLQPWSKLHPHPWPSAGCIRQDSKPAWRLPIPSGVGLVRGDAAQFTGPPPDGSIVLISLCDRAVGQAENWDSVEIWLVFQINVRFDDLPFRDHIRMDYAFLPAPDGSSDPDWPPEDMPPGPGCEVQ